MPEIKFTTEQIDNLLAEVGIALQQDVASKLRKDARDDAPAEESPGSGGPAVPPPAAAPPEASAPPMEASPEASPEAAPPEASAPPMGAEGGEGAIEPAPTVEQLQAEYQQLDPEQLKMHFLACKAAVMALAGQQDPGAGAEGSAPPMGAPPEASAPPAGAPPAFKAEVAPSAGNGGKVEMGKSERDLLAQVAQLKKQAEESQASLEAFKKSAEEEMGKFVKVAEAAFAPVRKSVRGISELRHIPRETTGVSKEPGRPLTKAEVKDRLRSKIRSGSLSEGDKELVRGYDLGSVEVGQLAHLLVDAK